MEFAFGSGFLWASRNDIANGTPVRFGGLQDVTIDFDGEVKELYGQYKYPIDVAAGKAKITGKAKSARISAVQFNSIYFGESTSTGQKLVAEDEAGTVPSMSTYTVTVANAANFVADLGVRYASTGEPLALVASGPTTGQYSVSGSGVYTFAAAQAGIAMLFDYIYSTTGGFTVAGTNQAMGYAPRFGATFTDTYEGSTVTLRLYSCICNKLSFAGKIDDYMIPEFDFSAYANSSNQVYEFSAAT
jgi:hypothetical protein